MIISNYRYECYYHTSYKTNSIILNTNVIFRLQYNYNFENARYYMINTLSTGDVPTYRFCNNLRFYVNLEEITKQLFR